MTYFTLLFSISIGVWSHFFLVVQIVNSFFYCLIRTKIFFLLFYWFIFYIYRKSHELLCQQYNLRIKSINSLLLRNYIPTSLVLYNSRKMSTIEIQAYYLKQIISGIDKNRNLPKPNNINKVKSLLSYIYSLVQFVRLNHLDVYAIIMILLKKTILAP